MLKNSVLFVCSGNVFRSVSAELLLKKYLKDNNILGWEVSSAGTIAKKEGIHPKTVQVLMSLGVKDVEQHVQKKLSRDMLEEYAVVVVMAKNHKSFIQSQFNFEDVFLFNELAVGEETSVTDLSEEESRDEELKEKKIDWTVRYIYRNIPNLFEALVEILEVKN